MKGTSVGNSYAVKSAGESQMKYDVWASSYEADLMAMGYRLPWMFAAVVARFVEPDEGPVLDAGCGSGMQAEALKLLGYGNISGADLSIEMMSIARAKGIYASCQQIVLGESLPFDTGQFPVTLSCGVITPGHAPASAFDELARVTRKGGKLIFSLRDDPEQLPEYPAKIAAMAAVGTWREIFRTDAFQSLPLGEPVVRHRIHVCEVLA